MICTMSIINEGWIAVRSYQIPGVFLSGDKSGLIAG